MTRLLLTPPPSLPQVRVAGLAVPLDVSVITTPAASCLGLGPPRKTSRGYLEVTSASRMRGL